MHSISRTYDALSNAVFVGVAGLTVVFTCASVLYDVCMRTIGAQPPAWTSAATEYSMLILTMAAAPYLVRRNGHVRVEFLSGALPRPGRIALQRAVALSACGVSLTTALVALRIGLDVYSRGELDIRSIEMPRWILFAMLVAGFGLCAVEFFRQALSGMVVSQEVTEDAAAIAEDRPVGQSIDPQEATAGL